MITRLPDSYIFIIIIIIVIIITLYCHRLSKRSGEGVKNEIPLKHLRGRVGTDINLGEFVYQKPS